MNYQITRKRLLDYKNKLEDICDTWRYNGPKFNKARLNIGINPMVDPFLWRHWIDNDDIFSDDGLIAALRKHPRFSVEGNFSKYSDDEIVEARCYQFRSGFLREIDLATRLVEKNKKCEVWRDDDLDTGDGGVDIILKLNKINKKIAVRHRGTTTDTHLKNRKLDKMASDVIVVIADWRPVDLDLVSEEKVDWLLEE